MFRYIESANPITIGPSPSKPKELEGSPCAKELDESRSADRKGDLMFI